jgi:hypothetical protein
MFLLKLSGKCYGVESITELSYILVRVKRDYLADPEILHILFLKVGASHVVID